MSNLTGNYKISAGEVQGLDVAREQERRARLQLLDEIREPSPQPIFGEPVKVELEDETSRRIKNTLGDFTQVLVNDPKNLLGIARSNPVGPSGHSNAPNPRVQPPLLKKPPVPPPNGLYKQPPAGLPKPAPDKRLCYPRNKPPEPGIAHIPIYSQDSSRNRDPPAWDKETKKMNLVPGYVSHQPSTVYNASGINNMSSYSTPNVPLGAAPVLGNNKPYPPVGRNGMVPNPPVQVPRYGDNMNSIPPPKRPPPRPLLKIPERKTELPAEGSLEVETILREMKQTLPPPITAIQTPRTEESGFAFPAEPREDIMFGKVDSTTNSYDPVPQPPAEPKSKENSQPTLSLQPTPASWWKKPDIAMRVDNNNPTQKLPVFNNCGPQKVPVYYDTAPQKPPVYNESAPQKPPVYNDTASLKLPVYNDTAPQKLPVYNDTTVQKPTVYNVQEPAKPVGSCNKDTRETAQPESWTWKKPEPISHKEPAKDSSAIKEQQKIPASTPEEDPSKYISSLQDDLEMSDSDDEVVTETKTAPAAPVEIKPPPNATGEATVPSQSVNNINNNNNSSNNISNMNVPPAVASNSSSSESGDSDSDDSSSESNDSDSSASSEASDADTPSKMWGLSNFFDETRRNHSPATFLPLDTSTNSSSIAVKEEPLLVPTNDRESYSLVDDDSVNGILREYNDLKDYLSGPIADPISDFLELDNPVNIKSEILSPIPSPQHSSVPPAPPVRGPRTPPSPSCPIKEESAKVNGGDVPSDNAQMKNVAPVEQSQPPSQNNKLSENSSVSDGNEETGKGQNDACRKQLRPTRSKLETCSPKVEPLPVTQSSEDAEPSASKGLPDASVDKEKEDVATNVMTSSNSVPSETLETSHENYSIKTRQKLSVSSASAKKNKSLSAENISESCQKSSYSTAKVPAAPKQTFKHPTRACRIASSEQKQTEKSTNSTRSKKSDQNGEPKRRSRAEQKEKESVCSSEKSKPQLKTSKNVSKNSGKVKNKISKIAPKQLTDGKKTETKRKKGKFKIENFFQSPSVNQNESERNRVSPIFTPSPERSPIPQDYKKDAAEVKGRPSVSPGRASRSPSRSSSKSVERVKNGEKLRRSARCSERASVAQAESSTATRQTPDSSKRPAKTAAAMREQSESLPVQMEVPQQISPIPQYSPVPDSTLDCAIPFKIMVSIPLEKITRLPAAVQSQDSEAKQLSKSKPSLPSAGEDAKLQKKDALAQKRTPKNVLNKRSQSKDFKDKPRTVPPVKCNRNNKNVSVNKKENNSKPPSEPFVSSKTKINSGVNNKSSIKIATEKAPSENKIVIYNDNKINKKRKSEDDEKQISKKKPKISRSVQEKKGKEKSTSIRKEAGSNQGDISVKSKTLERCDSASSLSSLCSQQSQRSSKSLKEKLKDANTSGIDAKRIRGPMSPIYTSKEIKQEKEDKPKVHVKKEPGSASDKNKAKSREKMSSKDLEYKEKGEQLWNDSLNLSSQFLADALNRSTGLDWDHFGTDLHKDLKEASNLNKHSSQTPMPMDYFWTEGWKQRQLAEKEKDPLLQALKYLEATVLFVLTSQQREEYTKDLDSVYQFYKETLTFSNMITQSVQKLQPCSGSTEFKLLILCLKCQSLLNVKLYNLKIKEIKEQQKSVEDFFRHQCPNVMNSLNRNPSHLAPLQPRIASLVSVPSPHSPTPSPASSVNSQTSGYSSSEVGGNHMRNSLQLIPPPVINVSQNMLDMICQQHAHLINLHQGHDLWEQADMYMTRSNLREFFKEVADQSEPLTLHSSIKELVNYIQKGLSLVKKGPR